MVRAPLLPRWLRWLAVTGLGGFIFYVSVLTVPLETAVDAAKSDLDPLDRWRHFLVYAAFGGALVYATTLVRHDLAEEFGVEYSERHVRQLMSEAGLSWTARTEFYKSDERAQEAWQEG